MAHEIEKMSFFGKTPWHGLGIALDEADLHDWHRTCAKAGLDWDVELAPLVTADTSAKVRLSPKRCLEVVEFIEKTGGTRQLSMRLYEPSMKKVEYALKNRVSWRQLVRSQLDQIGISDNIPEPMDSKNHDLSVMAQAIATHPASVKMQEEFWCKATGKSRASFFRTKKAYEAEKKNNV